MRLRLAAMLPLLIAALAATDADVAAEPSVEGADPCQLGATPAAAAPGAVYSGEVESLWTWVRKAKNLPLEARAPQIRVVAAACLEALHGATHTGGALGVEALYDARTATVLLHPRWGGEVFAARSVLVHEFVHYAQALAGQTFGCPAAAEKDAYALQEAWLAEAGLDLASVHGLDRLTLLVLTECGI